MMTRVSEGGGKCTDVYTRDELRLTVAAHVLARTWCDHLLAIPDPEQRARALAPYLLYSTAPDDCRGALFTELPHALAAIDRRAIRPVRDLLRSDYYSFDAADALGVLRDRASFAEIASMLPAVSEREGQWPKALRLLVALHRIDARRARPLGRRVASAPRSRGSAACSS